MQLGRSPRCGGFGCRSNRTPVRLDCDAMTLDISYQTALPIGMNSAYDRSWSGMQRTNLGMGAWIDRQPGWCGTADALFLAVIDALDWQAGVERIRGMEIERPRLVSSFPRESLPQGLEVIREMSQVLSERYGVLLDRVTCNLYQRRWIQSGLGGRSRRPYRHGRVMSADPRSRRSQSGEGGSENCCDVPTDLLTRQRLRESRQSVWPRFRALHRMHRLPLGSWWSRPSCDGRGPADPHPTLRDQ